LFEDAALDLASKLVDAQLSDLCLLAGEGTQLTFRVRRDATVGCGHAAD
jgi:hypothetical protein